MALGLALMEKRSLGGCWEVLDHKIALETEIEVEGKYAIVLFQHVIQDMAKEVI
jgi:hypothetical protein